MANNYTQFSVALNVGTAENCKAAMAIYNDHQEAVGEAGDDRWDFSCSDSRDQNNALIDPNLWIYAEEGGNPEAVIDFVTTVGKALGLKGKWGFSWADTCSRMRLDEFGGGAAVVDLKTGRVEFVNTYDWLRKKLKVKRAA